MLILTTEGGDVYGAGPDDIIWTNPFEAKLFLNHEDAEQEQKALADRGVVVNIIPGPSPTDIYYKYIDLVRYITHRMKFSHYMEDAESYFGLIIMRGWHKHNVRVCRRTTWLGRNLSGHLLDERMKNARNRARREAVSRHILYREDHKLTEFSPEAQIMVGMIRTDPDGCRVQFSRANRKQKFEKHMRGLGWSREKVDTVLVELREMI